MDKTICWYTADFNGGALYIYFVFRVFVFFFFKVGTCFLNSVTLFLLHHPSTID